VFSVDTGDDTTAGTNGSIIGFGPGLPVIGAFKNDYLDKFNARKRSWLFTGASPGHAKNASNNYYVGNARTAPGYLGIAMGGAELPDAGFLAHARGTALLVNTRGNDTGDDGDYRIVVFNSRRGIISPYSLVEGDGWVGGLTADGFMVTDGRSEAIISRAVWNRSTATGTWGYAVNACRASAKSDGTDFPFRAWMEEGRIAVAFKTDASTWRQQFYDFSQGISASGLDEVLRGDGEPFGWSCPTNITNMSVGAVATKSDDLYKYCSIEGNAGSTGDGRLDRYDTGHQDNGSAVTATGYTATDLVDSLRKKEIKHARAVTKKNGTGLTIAVQTDKARTAEDTLTPGTDGTAIFGIHNLPPNSRARSPKEVVEFKVADDGSGTTPPEVWGIEAEIEVSASY
jgi:hypothetical protein